jgi:hypothetical protein
MQGPAWLLWFLYQHDALDRKLMHCQAVVHFQDALSAVAVTQVSDRACWLVVGLSTHQQANMHCQTLALLPPLTVWEGSHVTRVLLLLLLLLLLSVCRWMLYMRAPWH